MTTSLYQEVDNRMQAVLALLRGEKAADVSSEYGIARSDLYKFRRRALTAMREALKDQRRGPKQSKNEIGDEKERKVVRLCERYPTMSSYKMVDRLGGNAPNPRTIQRIRQRKGLPRVPVRAPTVVPARRLPRRIVRRASQMIKQKPHLGPERISWDLMNGENMKISPSSIKRLKYAMYPKEPKPVWKFYERSKPHSLWHGDFMEKVHLTDTPDDQPLQYALQFTLLDDYSRGYVFTDLFITPDQRDVIRGMIDAMRRWWVIPKTVIFDNGAEFKGMLLAAFCKNLGIRLTHTAVCHPQTNGKLERAFRDDMKDFYKQYDEWTLDGLRRDLPSYVEYRNNVRGHKALGGKPSSIRLRENMRIAPLDLLDRLESYAYYEIARKTIPPDGSIRMFGRKAYLGTHLAGVEVALVETLDGLEARVDGQHVGLLRNYRDMRQLSNWDWSKLPKALYFEKEKHEVRPLNAVAYQH